jgi:HK97 family phage portal protein
MAWNPFRRREKRATTVTQSSPDFLRVLGLDQWMHSAAGVHVTVDTALGVPAVGAAVNFLSNTIAGLPIHVYERGRGGRRRINGPVATILHDAVNPEWTSYRWRRYAAMCALTSGRGLTWIERLDGGRVAGLWPLDPGRVTVEMLGGRRRYRYRRPEGGENVYDGADVLDWQYMEHQDQIKARSPIMQNKDVIGAAIAATIYGSKFMQAGGVPPFAVTGNFQSGDAMRRAADDLQQAVQAAAKEDRQALVLPSGLEIKAIGGDPEKAQLVELQRFMVEQIARIYALPPTFLQDLTHGTYSNTEQQDLHLVKHTLRRWIEDIEQELNLKLFGAGARRYCEFNVDALLRGDFKTRMEGHAMAIQHGIETPNEARARENAPDMDGGDVLLVQGAMVPLSQAGRTSTEGGEE